MKNDLSLAALVLQGIDAVLATLPDDSSSDGVALATGTLPERFDDLPGHGARLA
jgi:hypothetical protein